MAAVLCFANIFDSYLLLCSSCATIPRNDSCLPEMLPLFGRFWYLGAQAGAAAMIIQTRCQDKGLNRIDSTHCTFFVNLTLNRKRQEEEQKRKEQQKILGKGRPKMSFTLGGGGFR